MHLAGAEPLGISISPFTPAAAGLLLLLTGTVLLLTTGISLSLVGAGVLLGLVDQDSAMERFPSKECFPLVGLPSATCH